jgi:D-glycero-D-manno-heptose 1,7-bisphosphate phosphatase
MQAVILVGGLGMRLRPLTLTTPKPMIPIHGKPFAEYLIELLRRNGVTNVLFLTGYLGEQFQQHFGDGSKWGMRIEYSHSSVDNDTGERLRIARPHLEEQFLLIYGDNYWPLDLAKLQAHRDRLKTPAVVTVFERPDPGGKNNMRVEGGLVLTYDKGRTADGLNGVDIGFFILTRDVLDLMPEGNVNFEASVLPQLVAKKQLAGFLTKEPYVSLTSIDRLPAVEKALEGLA